MLHGAPVPHTGHSFHKVCLTTDYVSQLVNIQAEVQVNDHHIQTCMNVILDVVPQQVSPCFKGGLVIVLNDLNKEQPNFKSISGK